MKVNLVDFLDDNQKIYVNSNTGKGKTLILTILALLFLDMNPHFKIISNYHLNIFDKKTNESKCIYSKYGLLPFSDLLEGNYLIIIDDFISVKNQIENFGSILATLVRKLNVHVYISIHYYTHLIKENRELFNYEIIPILYNIVNKKLTNRSYAKLECLNPSSLTVDYKFSLYNLLEIVKGDYIGNNVYVKGNLYNTYELVHFINERKLINEIIEWSKDISDLEQNIDLITNKRTRKKYLMKECLKQVNF